MGTHIKLTEAVSISGVDIETLRKHADTTGGFNEPREVPCKLYSLDQANWNEDFDQIAHEAVLRGMGGFYTKNGTKTVPAPDHERTIDLGRYFHSKIRDVRAKAYEAGCRVGAKDRYTVEDVAEILGVTPDTVIRAHEIVPHAFDNHTAPNPERIPGFRNVAGFGSMFNLRAPRTIVLRYFVADIEEVAKAIIGVMARREKEFTKMVGIASAFDGRTVTFGENWQGQHEADATAESIARGVVDTENQRLAAKVKELEGLLHDAYQRLQRPSVAALDKHGLDTVVRIGLDTTKEPIFAVISSDSLPDMADRCTAANDLLKRDREEKAIGMRTRSARYTFHDEVDRTHPDQARYDTAFGKDRYEAARGPMVHTPEWNKAQDPMVRIALDKPHYRSGNPVPFFGTTADRIDQARVVTPEEAKRAANSYLDREFGRCDFDKAIPAEGPDVTETTIRAEWRGIGPLTGIVESGTLTRVVWTKGCEIVAVRIV